MSQLYSVFVRPDKNPNIFGEEWMGVRVSGVAVIGALCVPIVSGEPGAVGYDRFITSAVSMKKEKPRGAGSSTRGWLTKSAVLMGLRLSGEMFGCADSRAVDISTRRAGTSAVRVPHISLRNRETTGS
jgi:hypothetical protein